MAIRDAPESDLSCIAAAGDILPVWTERHGHDAIDGLRQDGTCQIRLSKVDIVSLCPLQIGLPDGQVGTVLAVHMPVEPDQQVDHIASPIALDCAWQATQLLQQMFEALLQACRGATV